MAIKLSEIGRSDGERAVSAPKTTGLAKTCGHAAEHMAKARAALDSESLDTGRALAHLDEAISCLQQFSRRGGTGPAEAESTVLAFQPAKDRRSA